MKVDIPRSAFSKEGEQYRDAMDLGCEDMVALAALKEKITATKALSIPASLAPCVVP